MNPWEAQLEQDLNWREAELGTLKVLAAAADPGSTRQISLLRALWALLYAHYEGFCKYAWDTYLDHLQAAGAIRADCVPAIARFSLAQQFRTLRGDLSADALWQFCTSRFQSMMAEPLAFDARLETQSNLWPDLCRKNLAAVSLPHVALDRQHTRLSALVTRRNEIAHGKRIVIQSVQEYQQYENAAFDVMYELAQSIVDCLDNRTYLTAPHP